MKEEELKIIARDLYISKSIRNGNPKFYSLKGEYRCLTNIYAKQLKELGIKYQSHQYYYQWQFIIKKEDLVKLKPIIPFLTEHKRKQFEELGLK